ncbi:putative nepenthesin [Lupinus albus]|uniref:Putative nepenthesin n=1 Tax=Lupinus albus TaxID=3870 RepID=A0A6A4PE05_LUPAL|nr:putative nepenthesin [Lupinus albus]
MASTIFLFAILLFACFIPSKSLPIHSKNNHGFTLSLIHRDSPESTFYNHSMTPYERRVASTRRSVTRMQQHSMRAKAKSKFKTLDVPDISSEAVLDNLEYIASYSIGTPPTKVNAFIDTGFDIIWTMGNPTFDPSKSSTYKKLSCVSKYCLGLGDLRTCPSYESEPCTYDMTYDDGSRSFGVLGEDKFMFDDSYDPGKTVDAGYLHFGINNESSPNFKGNQHGALALDRGLYSLLGQLGITKFSHCFVRPDTIEGSRSRMYFGSNAKILYSFLVPLVQIQSEPLYFVEINVIRVGMTEIEYPSYAFDGGVVIDTGISNSMLTTAVYDPFVSELRNQIKLPVVKGPLDQLELCFQATDDEISQTPEVVLYFSMSTVYLSSDVVFEEYSQGIWCLAILRSSSLRSMIGNIQMRNLLVGYDLQENGISFSSADCNNV